MFLRVLSLLRSRPLTLSGLTFMTAVWFATVDNLPLWRALWNLQGGFSWRGGLFLLAAVVLVSLFFNLVLSLFTHAKAAKPILIVLLLMSSAVVYFIDHFGVLIDSTMIQNTFETDVREARDLFSWGLLWHVLLLGVIPSFVVYLWPVRQEHWLRDLLKRLGILGLSGLLIMAGVLVFYQDIASLARNHRELRYMLVPSNYLYATGRYFYKINRKPAQIQAIGTDARVAATWAAPHKPRITVLVVGETARADHFSLNGYGRDTNPLLRRQDILNFTNVFSCGTSTAVSVPCMFSNLGRENYSEEKGRNRQGLLDVVSHAGIPVQWRDNNSGCKGVCDRVQSIDYTQQNDPKLCKEGECLDEIMLKDVQTWIDQQKQDAVLVLHQKGSHGPAYYLRYPQRLARFTPECKTSALEKCDQSAIINTFDNSILYTDDFLNQVITLLQRNADQHDSAMIYLSDHGESLGENNLYLHGTPYSFAPEAQKHVPMVFWFSPGFKTSQHIDEQCLRAARDQPYSQDNLFHSMLGLLNVETQEYNRKLDMFAACRK